jgi:GcrA cell cycle regulator
MENGTTHGWTEERAEAVRRMWTDGESSGAIARQLGVTRNAVISKVHRMKLPMRAPNGWTEATKALALPARRSAAGKLGARMVRTRPAHLVPRGAPKLPSEPLPPPSDLDTARKPLTELQSRDCRWPVGDPRQAGFGFCAMPRDGDGPYCEHHMARAYRER